MNVVHIRLKNEVHKMLKAFCALHDKSMTELIGDLVTQFLREYKES